MFTTLQQLRDVIFAKWVVGCPTLLAAVFLVLPVPTRAAPLPGTLTWSVRADIPGGVEGAAGGVIGSRLFVSHGFRFGDSADLSIYDIPSDSWTLGPAASVIRSEMAGGVAGGKLYAIGGRTGPNADVEAFDPLAGTWSAAASLSAPRGGLGAASIGGLIYAVGGRDGSIFGAGTILGTNEVFNPGTNTWTTLARMPTPLSDVYATVGFGGKVYVLGGASAPGTVTGLVQIYDPGTDTWSTGAPMPTPRAAAMAGVLCNQIIAFGGVNPAIGNLSTTEIYDPADNTWSTGPSMPIPVSEVAQGPTQTADTIFSVGSGIFGVTGTTVQALVASGCQTLSLPKPQIPCSGPRCRVRVACNLPQSQVTQCTNQIDVFAFVRRGSNRLSGDTEGRAPRRIRFAFAIANVPPGEIRNVRLTLTKTGKRITRMGPRRLRGVVEIRNTPGSVVDSTRVRIRIRRR
ncbi:MAG: Kelch repeat-containing protein [bacterium]